MTEQAPADNLEHLAKDIDDLAKVFNIADVKTEVTPGIGWHCRAEPEQGITINIDPEQLAQPSGQIDNRHVLFAARHELQHASDMLNPEWEHHPNMAELSETDKFFWGGIHDITIDSRTVNDYRSYRQAAPDLYRTLVKDTDIHDAPKHIQLMTGLRFQSVLGEESPLRLDHDVQETIDRLRNHQGHDLTEVLAHKGTTLQQRITLAQQFIKPEFDKLANEERQDHSEEEMEQAASQASQQADMTQSGKNSDEGDGNEKEKDDGGNENDSGGDDGQDQGGGTFEEQLEQAAEEYMSSKSEPDEDQDSQTADSDKTSSDGGGEDQDSQESSSNSPDQDDSDRQRESAVSKLGKKLLSKLDDIKDDILPDSDNQAEISPQKPPEETLDEIINKLGGTVKTELGLRKPDALAYARALLIYRPLIEETARIFQRLASIDEAPARTVHTRQALPEGEKLHTGRLPQAYIQGVSDVPMDIWRGKKRLAPRITRQFSGLDVWLHVDASVSMNGAPALHAAELSLVLVEGLLLARRYQAKEIQAKQPDVRVGSMIFAGDTETIMPLSFEPSGRERATMFINTKKAGQYSTLVVPGLQAITKHARRNPKRDTIGIVISDNEFGDQPGSTVYGRPRNCTIWNFSIGGGDSLGVGQYSANIYQTAELPANLLRILKYYEKQFLHE